MEKPSIPTQIPASEPRNRMIVRFFFKGRRKIIRRNMTRSECVSWCSREDSKCPKGKWFDGFDTM